MKLRLLTIFVALFFLPDCGSFYDDNGAPDPASWWPSVCSDGALAPESGCLTAAPSCPRDGATDSDVDGGRE
jgi:hypothetical protein